MSAFSASARLFPPRNTGIFALAFLLDFIGDLTQTELDLVTKEDVSRVGLQSGLAENGIVNLVLFKDSPHLRNTAQATISQQKRLGELEHLQRFGILCDSVIF